jgi:hypothetical protein
VNEQFLGSVSAFIRRCFEYADPDHPINQEDDAVQKPTEQEEPASTESEVANDNAFAIGDDEDEEDDLLAFDGPQEDTEPTKKKPNLPSQPVAAGNPTKDGELKRSVSKAQSEKANAALDPSNPLYMTLPTFRMVVLADELLEQFFESSFPTSIHIIDGLPASAIQSSALTTFASFSRTTAPAIPIPQPGARGPTRSLRGVLDNIVTDASRVAAEVRRRMEEAQRELEKNALPGQGDEEDEEDDDLHGLRSAVADPERRSVLSTDRDLLDGADAEAGGAKGQEGTSQTLIDTRESPAGQSRTATQAIVEFEG